MHYIYSSEFSYLFSSISLGCAKKNEKCGGHLERGDVFYDKSGVPKIKGHERRMERSGTGKYKICCSPLRCTFSPSIWNAIWPPLERLQCK